MAYENYKVVSVEVRGKVAYATINNPPINLITGRCWTTSSACRANSKPTRICSWSC